MAGIDHQAQRVARDLAQRNAVRRPPALQAHEAHVQLATRERAKLLGREHLAQLQADRRKPPAVGMQRIGQQVGEGQ